MNPAHGYVEDKRLLEALAGGNSSTRLKAALAIGTRPQPGVVDVLVARCAVEPDFFVRDMLTWALTRAREREGGAGRGTGLGIWPR